MQKRNYFCPNEYLQIYFNCGTVIKEIELQTCKKKIVVNSSKQINEINDFSPFLKLNKYLGRRNTRTKNNVQILSIGRRGRAVLDS